VDAFIKAIPDDPYQPCPCGCGQKWKFVKRDPNIEQHVEKFVKDFLQKINIDKEWKLDDIL